MLNRLEKRFYVELAKAYGAEGVLSQAVRLELARGLWYKPDFVVPKGEGMPTAYEVKGPKVFRGGFENLKVAARVHRWLRFVLVWEGENGEWERQEVLP